MHEREAVVVFVERGHDLVRVRRARRVEEHDCALRESWRFGGRGVSLTKVQHPVADPESAHRDYRLHHEAERCKRASVKIVQTAISADGISPETDIQLSLLEVMSVTAQQ